ncbi:DUF3616 domain-containing protein [Mangrovicoccus algicola]|uniref:DUF3616 domain-containing protein n=1 Tax=Mangrovicoccus algicola TaxID=2771008 RepID=A0A8J6YZ74_9RHOB|nr:DUF3616 domain-containing protein [Mangrovicoccus algicola]MBE3640330.1 DUF3616 domain-containing protein [Mangrovicoccus algicola]
MKDSATGTGAGTAEDAPEGRVRLQFDPSAHSEQVHRDISTVTRHGEVLFLSCDETAGIERLVPVSGGWGGHAHLALGDFLDLPGGADGEMDIEGLAVDGDWLWFAGSQSLKRGKPDAEDPPGKRLDSMARIKWDVNRQVIGRVPLERREDGVWPVGQDGPRRAAMLKPAKRGRLRKWLAGDPHLDAFLDIPSKDNGLDAEGLAARGDRLWLGLRGPVLRGHTVILEMRMKETGDGWLKPRKLEDGRRYIKHLLPLGGHGVRDLALDGDDILVLTGTPLDAGGRSAVWRWRDGTRVREGGVRPASEVALARALPYRGNTDNPEGLVRWDDARWLITHDSPAAHRLGGDDALEADLWCLEG